ncbi:MAG TPA: hypothetical protein VMW11_09580 [Candidatus Dormibacteraeota bacterium]|nr:hypothetical protein [Candidatus Dormibacteraeota bacterium]
MGNCNAGISELVGLPTPLIAKMKAKPTEMTLPRPARDLMDFLVGGDSEQELVWLRRLSLRPPAGALKMGRS